MALPLGAWSQQRTARTTAQSVSAAQMQAVNKFAAPLSINIPREWEYYFADGIGRLDATGISIVQKYLTDIFAALDANARDPYTLLIAEHFRNDYRQHKKMPPEYIVAESVLGTQPYVESAKSAFENMRQEIIDTYLQQIEMMRLRMGGGKTKGNNSAMTAKSGARPTNVAGARSFGSQTTTNRTAVVNSEKKHFAAINERASTIDRRLANLEQNIEQYNQRISQIETRQVQPSRAPQQAWTETTTYPAAQPLAAPRRQGSSDKQLRQVVQIARSSEQRLAAIEQRENKLEQEIVKIDNDLERIEAKMADSPQPVYVQPESKVIRTYQPPVSPRVGAPAAAQKPVAAAANSVSTQQKTNSSATTINTFHPQNNTAGGACSIETCTAIEDWLMKWYSQYAQYTEDKKKASKFLTALKETKDIYDKQKQSYPKKVKFLLKKFDMIPYDA
jgi:hypothetical protein